MASLFDVALSDMRIPGHGGYDITSYANNDDVWWLRNSASAFTYHAQVVQGNWPNPLGFDSDYNRDAYELAWFDAAPQNQITWSRMNHWYHCALGKTYQDNHASGWVNNTHVMVWGHELWVKSKSSGQWTRRINSDSLDWGGWCDPNIWTWYAPAWSDRPNESWLYPETGYRTWRLIYPANDDPYAYLAVHSYTRDVTIDPYDVDGVISMLKASLVLHDENGTDDRDASRFMLGAGADYHPDDSSIVMYPSCGAGRMKYVRAKWPNWQYHVFHTLSEPEMNAVGGWPSELLNLSEGSGSSGGDGGGGGGGGGGSGSTIVAPTIGEWQALTENAAGGWGSSGVANTPANKVRRRRGVKIWS